MKNDLEYEKNKIIFTIFIRNDCGAIFCSAENVL